MKVPRPAFVRFTSRFRTPLRWSGSSGRRTSVRIVSDVAEDERVLKCFVAIPHPPTRIYQIPDAQRIEYNALFENLFRMINDVNEKLPHYAVLMKEEVIKKLILMVSQLRTVGVRLWNNLAWCRSTLFTSNATCCRVRDPRGTSCHWSWCGR